MEKSQIYQLKVTLKGVKPPIWRRILIYPDTLMPDVHKILQVTMGWNNCHLHQFTCGGILYAMPSPDEWDALPSRDYRNVKISKLLQQEGAKMVYEYDFGDGWEHQILLEKILPPIDAGTIPICIAGKNACPPEDCGGVWRYMHLLEVIANPKHDEHKAIIAWVGRKFDPKYLNVDEINKRLVDLSNQR